FLGNAPPLSRALNVRQIDAVLERKLAHDRRRAAVPVVCSARNGRLGGSGLRSLARFHGGRRGGALRLAPSRGRHPLLPLPFRKGARRFLPGRPPWRGCATLVRVVWPALRRRPCRWLPRPRAAHEPRCPPRERATW